MSTLCVNRRRHRIAIRVEQVRVGVQRNGWTFHEFLTKEAHLSAEQHRRLLCDPDYARTIAYLDPVGNTAAANVDRERGQR